MRKLLLFIFIIVTFFSFSDRYVNGQPWMKGIKLKSTEEVNFYDIQRAFNEYWKDRPIERSKGYNPFSRWLYFMEPRVYPSGTIPGTTIWDEIQEKNLKEKAETAAQANWTFLGPDDTPRDFNYQNLRGGSGRLNCIAFHPFDSNIIYVGAPSGGLWKTADGGQSWTTSTDQLAAIGISDIAIVRQNPDVIYLATGDGDGIDTYSIGILKSTNGGISWNPTVFSEDVTGFNHFRRILIHPVNPDIMIAASAKGIYKTTNGWKTYKLVKSGHFKDLEFKPSDPAVIYAASFSFGGNAGIYKSTDTGDSFNEVMTGLNFNSNVERIELAVTRANTSFVYALCSASDDGGFYGLYRSVNSGISWSAVYSGNNLNLLGWDPDGLDEGGQGWYDLTLAISPDKANEIFVGGVNIWKSQNGGSTWKPISMWYHDHEADYVHADHHMLIFNPYTDVLFSGNDGGIYKSYDKGATWNDISDGLQILQIYRFTNSVSDPYLNIAGNQDNGTVLRNASGWYEISGGDGMECFIDYTNEDIIYVSSQRGNLLRSTDGGSTFSTISPVEDEDGAWITPFIMHPEIPGILYSGYKDVYKSTDQGESWTRISDNLTDGINLNALAVAGANDNYIYASAQNKIWKTKNGGETWIDISDGIPANYITYIAVAETDPEKLWVSLSGYSDGNKIYYSSDGGETWENYSDGLPNVPANCIIYQNNTNKTLYAGTDIGVYYRDATMLQWADYSDNLPNVIVNDLAIHYASGKLRAGTYGRGLWETDLPPGSFELYADFFAGNNDICLNGETTFTYYGSAGTDSLSWNFGEDASPSTANTSGPHNVSYSSLGSKTVSLKVYKDGVEYTEVKTDIVNVVSEIDFGAYPSITSVCQGGQAYLFASGNHSFEWAPADGLNQTTGSIVIASPVENTTYAVKASSGTCTSEQSVQVLVATNDNVCDAITLNEGSNGYFTNVCATPENNEPVPPDGSAGLYGCEAQDGWCSGETVIHNSVWFKFVAPDYDIVSIETNGFDNQIAVYDAGTCNDLLTDNYKLIAANDDFPGKSDYSASIQEMTDLVPGNTYWLQVDGSYGGVSGIFSIDINNYRISSADRDIAEYQNTYINIYPNPNHGVFTLDYLLEDLSKVTIRIYNVQGKMLLEKHIKPSQHKSETIISTDNLSNGIYILQFINNNNYFYRKFIVE
jgi:photosystem II stability/assembly factor-like uncharacterized protein